VRSRQSVGRSRILVRPQQPAVWPLDELSGGFQDPSASIVFGFVFLASFLLLSQALFSFVGW